MAWRVPGYEPVADLGHGATGAVVAAHDAATGTAVAIRYLAKEVYQAPDFAERFRDDADVLERIEHPHVARLYAFVEDRRGAAVVSERIDGVSLRALLVHGGALEPEAACLVVKGLLLGLGELHGRGVVHRDLRPENILIDGDAVAKVVDAGIPAPAAGSAPVAGDPAYLAPELWTFASPSPVSDVYAATRVLLECLTGQRPRPSTDRARAVPDLAELPADTPYPLQVLVAVGLASQPEGRPRDADELLWQLERVAAEVFPPRPRAGRTGLPGAGLPGAATGPLTWAETGRAQLQRRMARMPAPSALPRSHRRRLGPLARFLPAPSLAPTLAAGPGRMRLVIAAGIAVLIAGGTVAILSALGPSDASPLTLPTGTRVPVTEAGPTVPTDPSAGAGADDAPPERPTNVRVAGRSVDAVTLTWDVATDDVGVEGYVVARDGQRAGTTRQPGFTDVGLTPETRYQFTVTAFDAAGNLSPASITLSATTLAEPDRTAPSAPTGLRSTGRTTTRISLAWTASRDDVGVAGYEVFRDGALIGSTVGPAFTDTGLLPGRSYTYAVRAFDTANNVSARSANRTLSTMAVTTTAPTTTAPPSPEVTGLTVSATGIAAPECLAAISAVVTVSGPMSVTITYTINGTTSNRSETFAAAGSHPVSLGSADGRTAGTASAAAGDQSSETQWTVPEDCATP